MMRTPPGNADLPGSPAGFTFDGIRYAEPSGQPLAVALLAAGVRNLRRDPLHGEARGAFCFMGICQECVVMVDGRRVEACRLPIRDGLVAERAQW